MKLIWGMLLTVALFALPARADAIYDISGTATLTGDDSCNGLCIETINFSFQLDEQPVPTAPGYDGLFAKNISITASGPLGPPLLTGNSDFVEDKYMGIAFGKDYDSELSEFDLTMNPFPPPSFPFAPEFIGGYLYSCASASCFGFCPITGPTCGGTVTTQSSITDPGDPVGTPEPGSLALLSLGLLPLTGKFRDIRRNNRRSKFEASETARIGRE
jgi:hypothetical protein